MRLTDAALSRLVLIRVVPGLVILLYLFVAIASHSVPMSSALGVPLAGAGIGTVIVVLFVTALRQFARKGLIIPPPRRWSGFVHLAFIAAVGVCLYFALTGNVSLACPQDATSCVKIDNWKVTGGHYYRQFPYDSAGNDDPGAPWVEISRQEYVADVGTLLRQDVLGGVIALCIAWPLAGIARHPEEEETGNRTGPLPDLTRPR